MYGYAVSVVALRNNRSHRDMSMYVRQEEKHVIFLLRVWDNLGR